MISSRDRQLQQLGIIQWVLRRPIVLQGEIILSIPTHIRLVIITHELSLLINEILVRDVLRTLNISINQVLQISPDRVMTLPLGSRCNSWWIGHKVPSSMPLEGRHLFSPTLKKIITNPCAKNDLWQQMCAYEQDFSLK